MISIKVILLLATLFLGEFARGAFFLTFLPLYSTDFQGWGITVAGMATSFHYLAETVAKTFAGLHLDRFGRPVILTGLILSLVSLLAIRLYPDPALLLGSAVLFGVSYSPLWLGIITEVAPYGIKNRPLRISFVFAAWLSGMGSGLIIINFIIPLGFHMALDVIITVFVLAVVISTLFYPKHFKKQTSGINSTALLLATFKKMLENKSTTRFLLPGMFLQTLCAGLLLPVLPVFARSYIGLNHTAYGFIIIAGGAAAVLFLIPMGKLVDSSNLKKVIIAGFLFSSLVLAGTALIGNKKNILLFAVAFGLSYAAILPAWNTLLAQAIPPEMQSTGWGLFSTIEGLGIAAGPVIGSILADIWAPQSAFFATAAILALMSIFYLFYPFKQICRL